MGNMGAGKKESFINIQDPFKYQFRLYSTQR